MPYTIILIQAIVLGYLIYMMIRQRRLHETSLKAMSEKVLNRQDAQDLEQRLSSQLERTERLMQNAFDQQKQSDTHASSVLREELRTSVQGMTTGLQTSLRDLQTHHIEQQRLFQDQLQGIGKQQAERLGTLDQTVARSLQELRQDNMQTFEQIRLTVDEKLQGTLEKRLTQAFSLVSERLEVVQKGLGEMQALANGVGDLKRVLTNVKTRGTWGEMQLAQLLDHVLTPGQYEAQVAIKPSSTQRVDFAIKLPGKSDQDGPVFLPIDAKFPQESYEAWLTAQETGDLKAGEDALKQLEQRIKAFAKDVSSKYIHPPTTTDFAIIYLPTEGLYAEVLRRPGLVDLLQAQHRITLAGPTTLSALLNSLQMGFRSLAIQKASGEIWKLLDGIKLQFGQFSDLLAKVQKKLTEASNVMDSAAAKSRGIETKLQRVEKIPMPTD